MLAADEAITEAPSNVTATLGEDVALTCRTHLELHRHMSWVRLTEDAIVELAQVGNRHTYLGLKVGPRLRESCR